MMTRSTDPHPHGSSRSRRPQWVRAATHPLQIYVFLWACAWGVAILAIVVALLVIDRVGTVNISAAQFVRNGPLVWFLFALAIGATSIYLTPHVANGMTRRSFGRGALVAGGVNGVLHGLTASVVMVIEGVVYRQMGWPHDPAGDDENTSGVWEQGFGVMFIDYTLVSLAGVASGLLVAIAYYRLGGWWGTLALPLTMLPLLGVMFMSSWASDTMPWVIGEPVGNSIGVALLAASAVTFLLAMRNVTIARTES